MRILMINKFLYPNGGSETYIFKLGDYLKSQGHEVQYFGMEHEGRCVGNAVNAYTSDMDFHGGSKLAKLTYPLKTIYSSEARKKLHLVLDDFKPDVCHLNNFNYQLTPSIILEIQKWRKKGNKCGIVFTAHDYQLVCPNHMCNNPNTGENCEKCLGGHFLNCTNGKCIHGSTAKSAVGTAEAVFWKLNGAYKYIDTMICCSEFLKTKMDTNPLFAQKTVAMHNFVDRVEWKAVEKKDYALYFGRFSKEKGIDTLLKVCRELHDVQFIFAGTGPLENEIDGIPNIKNVGFQTGKALETLIQEARFSIYPSEWYENCPFSVMESQMYGTPVLGADIGGIPGVREDSAISLLNNMGIGSVQVLDPTLLLDSVFWSKIAKPIEENKYVLVYQLHNDKRVGGYAAQVAKAFGLPLIRVSTSFHQISREGKLIWCPEIGEFLSYIKNAACMVTDSFHGTAFAINFNTPFVEVLPNNKTGTRNMSILKLTGLSDRILRDNEDIALAKEKIDYSRANRIIKEKRKDSLNVLKNMIEN